jgi:uncharacterized membrane protein
METTTVRSSTEGYNPAAATPPAPPRARIPSLDIVRGVVVVLMAIDHVRVYSGQPAGGPTPGIFFTRWITHFVAPVFVFLAGTGAYFYGRKVNDRKKLASFLLTRGVWLVVLELTVIRVAWTFNFDFAHYMLAGVIWMIGWCMVLMAGIVFLPRAAILAGSLIVIFGHNTGVLSHLLSSGGEESANPLAKILYLGGGFNLGANGPPLLILFVLIPWIAVMAAGYAFGPIMELPPDRRRATCIRLGLAAIALFLVVRGTDRYGDQRRWHRPPTPAQASQTAGAGATPASEQRPQMPVALAFLNTSKYPASLSFLLMTLGPMLVLLGLVDQAHGPIARALETFGRVPMFYYLLHIPTIHLAAVIVSLVREGSVNPWLFGNHPVDPGPQPPGYMWSLPLLYLVWAIVIVVLYFACRWYDRIKSTSHSKALSYL